jgi:hypothetical protein
VAFALADGDRLTARPPDVPAERLDIVPPAANGAEIHAKKRGRPPLLPDIVPQQTWPEAEAVVFFLDDVRAGLVNTRRLEGEVAITHQRPGSSLSVKLGGDLGVDVRFVPLLPETHEELERLIVDIAGPRAPLLWNYLLQRAREEPARFTVVIDDLVNATGPQADSRQERLERRQEAWDTVRIFLRLAVIGRRPAYRPKKGEPDTVQTFGPMLAFLEAGEDPGQLALFGSTPPREVTLTAGPWFERMAVQHPDWLPYFGDTRQLAQRPDARAPYTWVSGIEWALNVRWRQSASRSQRKRQGIDFATGQEKDAKIQTRDFTRRELLDYRNPDPHYREILDSDHPRRAVALWKKSIAALIEADIIGPALSDYVPHGPEPWEQPKDWPKRQPFKPQGWQNAWLDQKITIRPGKKGQAALREIVAKAHAARSHRKKSAPR